MRYDPTAVRDAIALLHAPGDVFEIRIPKTRKAVQSGYFDDADKAAAAVASWFGRATVYVMLNPINPALLARRCNRLADAETTTSDPDVTRRRWLLIDCDAARPSEISSSDEEHEAALERTSQIRRYLLAEGWPEGISADSGNGGHYIVPIDLSNDKASEQLLKDCLRALNMLFGDETIGVDEKNYNAARVGKLYGTISTKGDNVPGRPHRLARVLRAPASFEPVPPEKLQALAAKMPLPAPKETPRLSGGAYSAEKFDLGEWMQRHGVGVSKTGPFEGGGRKWELETCPWNPEHKRSAFVLQGADGTIRAGCLHNSCGGKMWRDLRLAYEPDAYDRQVGALGGYNDRPAGSNGAFGNGQIAPAESVARFTQTPFARRQGSAVVAEPVPAAQEWDEAPMPLGGGALPEFPLAALPPIIRDYASEVSEAMQVPLDMPAWSALGVISAINSRRCVVQVGDASRNHRETLNTYSVVVANSGEKKSPSMAPIVEPLREIERGIHDREREAHAAAVATHNAKVKRLSHLEGLVARGKSDATGSAEIERKANQHELEALAAELSSGPPEMPRILTQDITNEELANKLAQQPDNCIALMSSEAGIFSIIKGQYSSRGSLPNMDIYLNAYSAEPYVIDRAGRGNVTIPSPMLTMCLMVQPEIMRSVAADDQLQVNGFLGRFFYSVPPSMSGQQPYLYRLDRPTAMRDYHRLVNGLWNLEPSVTPEDKRRRFVLEFDEEATEVYAYFHNDVNTRRAAGQDLAAMGGWASKFPGNVARIAANLHMVKCLGYGRPWCHPIDGDTMAQAWAIGQYCIPHAMEAFGQMRSDATGALARRILGWIDRKQLEHFTFRECWQLHRSESKDKIELALLRLAEHAYVRLEAPRPTEGRGRPAGLAYGVNPGHTATFRKESASR